MTASFTLRASTACPKCRTRYAVDVRAQAKFSGAYTWTYTCTACGATGHAEPLGPPEQLAALPVGECGHTVAAAHHPHDPGPDVCPSCCPPCQVVTDQLKCLR